MSFRDITNGYIENHGFHLFPLKEQSKKPATTHGLHDATNKLVIAQGWWTKDSKLNIGLRTGEISGVWVLDVDGKNGEYDLNGLEFDNGDLPRTPCQKTANGKHYFFKYPAGLDIKNRTQIIKHDDKGGLDVRGNGGYVVLAPSIHPDTGMPYEWITSPQECPFADAPQWLLDLVIKAPEAKIEGSDRQPFSFNGAGAIAHKSTSPETIINDQIKMVETTNEGGRNHALNIAAMKVGRVIGSGVVDDGMAQNAINQLAGAAKAVGLGEDEIMPTINSGLKYGLNQPYEYGKDRGGNSREKINLNKVSVPSNGDAHDSEKATSPDLYSFYRYSDLLGLPPITWLIDGVFPNKSFSIIYGLPGKGKTFVALDMALCVASGIEWHGHKVQQGGVLYIAGEGFGGLSKRIGTWFKENKVDADNDAFMVLPVAVNLMNEADINKLLNSIAATGKVFTMVVIDTVARAILGGDENSSTDIGLFVKACDAIKEQTNASVIGIHHSGKDEGRGMRGSSALLGAVDTVLKVTQQEKIITVAMEKQKDAEPIQDRRFKMKVVTSGIGQTSVVLKATDDKPVYEKKASPTEQQYLKALAAAIENHPVNYNGNRACTIEHWRDETFARECTVGDPRQKKMAFNTYSKRMREKGFTFMANGMAWLPNGSQEGVNGDDDFSDEF